MKRTYRMLSLAMALFLLTAGLPTAFAQETTKITMASYQWNEAGFGDFYRYMAKLFHERYPQYEIEEVSIPVAQYWDKMIADCSADCPPDIMMYKGERAAAMIKAGELSVLNDLMSKETYDRLINEFQDCQTKAPVFTDGNLYGVYMMVASHQLMYNERLLREANIAVPTTAQEFVDAAIALTKAPDQYGYGFMTLSEDAFVNDIYMWALGFDGDIFNDGFHFDSDGVKQALLYYKQLFDAEATPLGVSKTTYRTMFAQGQVAFLIDGPWVYSFAQSLENNEADNIRTAAVPFETGRSVMSENLMTIPTDAKNKEGAMLYIEMCTEYANQAKFTELTNCTAGIPDAISTQWLAENPWFSGYVDGAAGATAVVPDKYATINNEIRKIVLDNCQEILYGNADIEKAVAKIQSEVDALAEKSGLQ